MRTAVRANTTTNAPASAKRRVLLPATAPRQSGNTTSVAAPPTNTPARNENNTMKLNHSCLRAGTTLQSNPAREPFLTSQKTDTVSPIDDKNIRKNRQLQAIRLSGRVRTHHRGDK